MDRRPLQLLAAFALVVSLLGVSTALVAEVREEVLHAQTRSEPEFTPPDQADGGLPITEFTLLDPVPTQFRSVSRAGNLLQVRDAATLFFSQGDRIQVAPVGLTGPSRVELPSGGTYKGNQLDCPEGCIVYGDRGRLAAPPNATLVLPQSAQLSIQTGTLSPGESVELPSGTRLFLAPITMSADTPLPAGPGATMILPGGKSQLPEDPSGGRYVLPAGTIVRGAIDQGEDVQRLLRDNPATAPPVAPPPQGPTQPRIEVTGVPEVIHKDKAFTVSGIVRTADGEPLPDHPVTVYANATKEAPGFVIQMGQVRTMEDGTFKAISRINASRPTQPYHIVAQAHARPDHDPPMLEAWSDPVVPVAGKPRLTLDLPATEGQRVPVNFRATLLDEFGASVPNQRIVFQVEESSKGPLSAITDEDGQALVVFKDGFPVPGEWNVSARFDGTDHLDPASDFQRIEIVDARIETDPTVVVPRGSKATINGHLRVSGGVHEPIPVEARYANMVAKATTDDTGTFQLHFEVPATLEVGNHTMTLRTTEGVTATRALVLTVTGQSVLTADAPEVLPLGGTLKLRTQVTDELGTPLAGVPATATVPGGTSHRALTDEAGTAVLPVPLSSLGRWTVNLTTPGTPLHASGKAEIPLSVGRLAIAGEPQLVAGETRNITLTFTVEGQPLTSEPVRVDAAGASTTGRTGEDGRVVVPLTLPFGAEPGTTELAVTLQRFNVVEHVGATILDKPRIDVDVLQPGGDGAPVRVRVVTVGQSGFLSGVPVEVEASGAFSGAVRGITDAQGTSILELDRPRGAEGPVLLTVTARETGTSAAAVQIASTEVTAGPIPWWLLAVLVPVAAGGYALWRYRHRGTSQAAPGPRGPTLELSIAPQSEGLPPVWHAGEPTVLNVRLRSRKGDPIVGAPVELDGPHGRARVTLDEQGEAQVGVPGTQAREISFHASFHGEGPYPPAETTLDVRLVNYREEIDREYRELRRRSAADGACGIDATPRELAHALGSGTAADRLARLFEVADYSPRPVGRSEYVAFMRAKEAVGSDGGDGAG